MSKITRRQFIRTSAVAGAGFLGAPAILSAANKPAPKVKKHNEHYGPLKDDPKLPRVLLIGDSISGGYTDPVREQLRGVANLYRIPANGGPTSRGLEHLDEWLGPKKWDVIHFNWGLHDLKISRGKYAATTEQYAKNLNTLCIRLKATGAKLIWCNTTPVPTKSRMRKQGDAAIYNKAAAKVIAKHNIPTNDLYTYAQKNIAKIQNPHDVHFNREGSLYLSKKVTAEIRKMLGK